MKTELYKTIKLSVNEAATLMVAIDKFIEHENESINFFFEKLNSAGSTQDVREWTASIKSSKERITTLQKSAQKITDSEIITKHHLEHIS